MSQFGLAWKIVTAFHIGIGIFVGFVTVYIATFFRKMDERKRLILQFLDNNDRLYGEDIARLSNGKLNGGTLYVLLHLLEEDGCVLSRTDGNTKERNPFKRRSYAITSHGRYELFRR